MKVRMFTLPNMITLCNLFCGCAALVFCLSRDDLQVTFWLVVAAAAFDFLDGFTARLTRQYSELGKQLDSLSDMVSFGAVPSAVLYTVYMTSGGGGMSELWGIATASVALFSALRLGKFNIDTNQSSEFVGMPTPACALFVCSAGYLFAKGLFNIHPVTVITVSLLLSYLLICPVKMFSLKFSDPSWNNNKVRYSFCVISAAALAVWNIVSVPFIIAAYIIVSAVIWLVCRKGAA